LPFFEFATIRLYPYINFGKKNVIGLASKQKKMITNQGTDTRIIDSVVVMHHKQDLNVNYFPQELLGPAQSDSIVIVWTPVDDVPLVDTILIYHNYANSQNPFKLHINGSVQITTDTKNLSLETTIQNYPNPFKNKTSIK
jgi:hypothetical protein